MHTPYTDSAAMFFFFFFFFFFFPQVKDEIQ
jgi:hypothetical protein